MNDWLYVAACVALPAVWGVVVTYAFRALRRRRARTDGRDERPPIDYSI